jgi:hypothetical protein
MKGTQVSLRAAFELDPQVGQRLAAGSVPQIGRELFLNDAELAFRASTAFVLHETDHFASVIGEPVGSVADANAVLSGGRRHGAEKYNQCACQSYPAN